MNLLGNEFGSWAEWVAALAAIVGLFLSIFALKRADEANTTADLTRREAAEARSAEAAHGAAREREMKRKEDERDKRERARDDRELEREARQLAGAVQAWWVAEPDGNGPGQDRWSVLVCNEGLAGSVFHDVHIMVSGNRYKDEIVIETLPPGRYYVPSVAAPKGWDLPRQVRDASTMDPILRSANHTVNEIRFIDPAGEHWVWTATSGLSRRRR